MSRALLYALAGLQAGIAGALALLLWMAVAARFFGKSVWWSTNLLASAFYGTTSLKFGFAKYTIVGAALVLFTYGALGILFGLLWRDRAAGATAFAASLILAIIAYYLLFKTAWHHFSLEGALYASDRQIFLGHLLFGFFLSRYPRYQRSLWADRVAKVD